VDSAKPQAVSLTDERRLIVLAVALAAIIFVFPLAVSFPLLDPDEGLHASIAQEMVEKGDWLVPHFLGKPFFDKPIFYFWCQALSLRLFGMNEAAVRLPGLIFGLLGAITTGLVGWRLFGRMAGWLSGIFYGTMILPVALAQAATHDVALVPTVNLIMLLLWQSDHASSKSVRWRYVAAIGFLLGVSVLTKGLTGVGLVVVSYGGYTLLMRRLSISLCLRAAMALLLGAFVASFWFIAVECKYPGYLYYFFIQRHLLGFATATQPHGAAPWWYYLPIILGGGLPWIGYLPVTVRDALARRRQKSSDRQKAIANGESSSAGAMALLWCWLIGSTVLLSLAHSKLITYIWPVFPAVAVLAAVGWARLLEGTLDQVARRSLLCTFLFSSLSGPIVLPLAVFAVHKIFAVDFSWPVWVAAALAGSAALVPLVFLRTKQWPAMLAASTLSTAIQFVVALTVVLPPVAEEFTARSLAHYFNNSGRLPPRLLMAEERLGSLVFYLDPALRLGLKENQLGRILPDQTTEIPPGSVIVLPENRAERADQYAVLAGLPYKTFGRYRLYEVSEQNSGQ
jgi:hypothetical protein